MDISEEVCYLDGVFNMKYTPDKNMNLSCNIG